MTALSTPSTSARPLPAYPVPGAAPVGNLTLRRFSVDEYHRMIELGIIGEDDRVELIEGFVVHEMGHNPPHDGGIDLVHDTLIGMLPAGWRVRTQQAITLSESEPEPDLAVVRGGPRSFTQRHPAPADIGLVVEVAESSLAKDRDEKARIYAGAGIHVYWIINLIDRQVEVHTGPSGPAAAPAYANRQVLGVNESVPLALDGAAVGSIPVVELLP